MTAAQPPLNWRTRCWDGTRAASPGRAATLHLMWEAQQRKAYRWPAVLEVRLAPLLRAQLLLRWTHCPPRSLPPPLRQSLPQQTPAPGPALLLLRVRRRHGTLEPRGGERQRQAAAAQVG